MKKLITSLALVLSALSSYAITPLWMRDARISPDGSEIVFCYKGDIYKVPAQGGTAVQLTTQTSYEANPVWSPDGKQIAFASRADALYFLLHSPFPFLYYIIGYYYITICLCRLFFLSL